MPIANSRMIQRGLMLAAGFLLILAALFVPMFGAGRNGLEYADNAFNELAKGSSYFIPDIYLEYSEKWRTTPVDVQITLKDMPTATQAETIITAAGLQVVRDGQTLRVNGNFGNLLQFALRDAYVGFTNNDLAFRRHYGLPAKTVLATWWHALRGMGNALAAHGQTEMATATNRVMKKGLEPSYNYFGIAAKNVYSSLLTLCGLLFFYLLYTMWWGSAIYCLFQGMGLMEHARTAPAH